ncbi:MAG: hypothetical protein HQM10_26515 [Candidatus Riflebacteria bacterium]|nr:hypothetical protein [Candidatus Riflebacteria bacterium]
MNFKKTVFVGALLIVSLLLAFFPVFGALTSSTQITISSTHTSAVGLSTAKDEVGYGINKTFSNGSGTTQVADLVYHASRTLTTAASENLDFAGTLTDSFGNTLTFARIKSITVENTSASMTLTIGSDTTEIPIFNPSGGGITVPPSGVMTIVAPLSGWAVTADTADLLTIANSAGSSTIYKVWVVGSSQ